MKAIWHIVAKDFLIEMRNKESLSSMTMFGFLVLVVFNFAFEPAGSERALIAPGILWVCLSFAGVLGMNRNLAVETDNECLQGLLLAPIGRGTLYLAKLTSNFAFIVFAQMVILPIFTIFYNLRFDTVLARVALISLLGTFGFVVVGTILSTVSANTRMREVMLPVLQFPLSMPVLIAAVEATSLTLRGDFGQANDWLKLVVAFDIIFFVVSYLVFDFVVEE